MRVGCCCCSRLGGSWPVGNKEEEEEGEEEAAVLAVGASSVVLSRSIIARSDSLALVAAIERGSILAQPRVFRLESYEVCLSQT